MSKEGKAVKGYTVMAYGEYSTQWCVAEGLSTRAAADRVIEAAVGESTKQVRYSVRED